MPRAVLRCAGCRSKRNPAGRAGAFLAEGPRDLFSCFSGRFGYGSKPNVPLVNIKIAGKWVFTPLTLIIKGFDTHPFWVCFWHISWNFARKCENKCHMEAPLPEMDVDIYSYLAGGLPYPWNREGRSLMIFEYLRIRYKLIVSWLIQSVLLFSPAVWYLRIIFKGKHFQR